MLFQTDRFLKHVIETPRHKTHIFFDICWAYVELLKQISFIRSLTFSDFLSGPVTQVFRQYFSHVALFWEHLDHL